MLNTITKFAMAAVLAGAFTAPSYAQEGNLKVDSDHSDASFSIDGAMNKTNQTIHLGAARVSGTVNLDRNDLTKSTFAFTLYPAGSPAIDPDLGNDTLISFQSERVSLIGEGKLLVTGNLSLTRVDRNADVTANEAYAGPVYGPPIVHRVTREASFVIAVPDPSSAEGQGSREIEASATAAMDREDFPQLLEAVLGTNWPPVVQDEECQMPASIGEDYAGAKCVGNMVQVPSLPVAYIRNGEDYSGPDVASAQLGNNLAISVHMQLSGEQGQLSAKAGK
jgi:polyisoprenoid-binding protein YceI